MITHLKTFTAFGIFFISLLLLTGVGCAPKKIITPEKVYTPPSMEFPPYKDEIPSLEPILKKEIVIGCLLPLSGKFKLYGESALKGIELAFDLFNKSGRQPLVSLAIRDTASKKDNAISGLYQLIDEEKADIIIGPMSSNAARAVSELKNIGIPVILMSQAEDILFDNKYIFRHFLTPRQQVSALISHAVNNGCVTFAILYPNDKYGQNYKDIFIDEVNKKGGVSVTTVAYNPQDTDFGNEIKKLTGCHFPPCGNKNKKKNIDDKDEPPVIDFDALFIPDSPDRLILIIPQLAYHDIDNIMLLGNNLWHNQEFISETYRYLNNVVLTDAFSLFSKRSMVQNYIRTFYATYESNPGLIDAIAFDTTLLAIAGFQNMMINGFGTIMDALIMLKPYNGITGLTKFSGNGDATKKLILFTTKGKEFKDIVD